MHPSNFTLGRKSPISWMRCSTYSGCSSDYQRELFKRPVFNPSILRYIEVGGLQLKQCWIILLKKLIKHPVHTVHVRPLVASCKCILLGGCRCVGMPPSPPLPAASKYWFTQRWDFISLPPPTTAPRERAHSSSQESKNMESSVVRMGTEAEFLDVIGKNVLRVFLLAIHLLTDFIPHSPLKLVCI